MTSISVSLPEKLREYVEQQVESGDWGSPAEYIRELIRQDKDRRLMALEEDLLESSFGEDSQFSADEIRRRGLVNLLRESRDR